MTKFLIKASYTPEGVKGLLKTGGTARQQAVEKSLNGLGGKIESFYFAFGDDDVYVIAELPDTISAAALALTINATGLVSLSTTILLDVKDIDEAVKRSVVYRAPGS
jgi:uncharacterized protein with GYD domain